MFEQIIFEKVLYDNSDMYNEAKWIFLFLVLKTLHIMKLV